MIWRSQKQYKPLTVDLHSHLIPGIDDGSKSMEKSIEMVQGFHSLGFEKLITTPHIHPNYPNSPTIIRQGLAKLKKATLDSKLAIEIEAAAEYYVDDAFLADLEAGNEFLTFGDSYLLIECSFIIKPLFFDAVLFKLRAKGYQPILAHPERYQFLDGNLEWLEELKSLGVLFQVTLGSLGGYYGKEPRKIALRLLKKGMVDFLASDLHHYNQLEYLKKGLKSKEVQQYILSGKLLNYSL